MEAKKEKCESVVFKRGWGSFYQCPSFFHIDKLRGITQFLLYSLTNLHDFPEKVLFYKLNLIYMPIENLFSPISRN